jgi:hypothetical protein
MFLPSTYQSKDPCGVDTNAHALSHSRYPGDGRGGLAACILRQLTVMASEFRDICHHFSCRVSSFTFLRHSHSMESGRLIRAGKYRGDRGAIAYIVAVHEAAEAIELVRQQASNPGDTIEDLGPVSEALLQSLKLTDSHFIRADATRQHDPVSEVVGP